MGFEDSDFENARKRMNENLYKGNDRSSSQLYKQAGNSIVVDVLLHIMENLYDAMPYLFEDMVVGSFFSGIGAFEKALTKLEPVNSQNELAPPHQPEIGSVEDGGVRCKPQTICINSKVNGKQPSLSKRIYD